MPLDLCQPGIVRLEPLGDWDFEMETSPLSSTLPLVQAGHIGNSCPGTWVTYLSYRHLLALRVGPEW